MQWQRVLHGFSEIEHVGRVHSVYEFSLKALPGQIVRVRVVESPEGAFFGYPDHMVVCDARDMGGQYVPPAEGTISPEKALQEAVRALLEQACAVEEQEEGRNPPDGGRSGAEGGNEGAGRSVRLVKLQNW